MLTNVGMFLQGVARLGRKRHHIDDALQSLHSSGWLSPGANAGVLILKRHDFFVGCV